MKVCWRVSMPPKRRVTNYYSTGAMLAANAVTTSARRYLPGCPIVLIWRKSKPSVRWFPHKAGVMRKPLLISPTTPYTASPAGIWSRDVARAMRMADRIEAGTVYINNYFNAATQSPVGGFKQSGYGRENGFEGMRCFMQTKSVWLSTNPHQVDPFAE